jgi:hypothetical protein
MVEPGGDLDEQFTVSCGRPPDRSRFPYLYLDATYCKVRVNHRIVSQTLVIAVGISEDGGREVLGVMVGDSETEAFWSEFLRASRERGLGHRRAQMHDEWIAFPRRYLSKAACQPSTPPNTPAMHSPTPRTLRTIDRLHHHAGHHLGRSASGSSSCATHTTRASRVAPSQVITCLKPATHHRGGPRPVADLRRALGLRSSCLGAIP